MSSSSADNDLTAQQCRERGSRSRLARIDLPLFRGRLPVRRDAGELDAQRVQAPGALPGHRKRVRCDSVHDVPDRGQIQRRVDGDDIKGGGNRNRRRQAGQQHSGAGHQSALVQQARRGVGSSHAALGHVAYPEIASGGGLAGSGLAASPSLTLFALIGAAAGRSPGCDPPGDLRGEPAGRLLQIRSNTAAIPWPPPMHMVTSA